jgi:hypothetical protein
MDSWSGSENSPVQQKTVRVCPAYCPFKLPPGLRFSSYPNASALAASESWTETAGSPEASEEPSVCIVLSWGAGVSGC